YHLLGLPIAVGAEHVVSRDFPTLEFSIVFEHQKRGVFGDDRIALAEPDDFIDCVAAALAGAIRFLQQAIDSPPRPHAIDLRVLEILLWKVELCALLEFEPIDASSNRDIRLAISFIASINANRRAEIEVRH